MALNKFSRLTGILPRVLFKRNIIAVAYPRKPLEPCLTHSAYVPLSHVTHSRGNIFRSLSSASDDSINISREQLKQVLANQTSVVIDVREPWELREYGNIPGTLNIPLGQVNAALQLSPEEFKEKYGGEKPSHSKSIIFTCLAGIRSKTALDTAVSLGYTTVQHYPGGWQDWAKHEVPQPKH
ncbi:hypothetical protein GJAV_G00018990 [Gymnothorax javanicus]|nr:hypothetical protein GJAV_G00018990 [Gymnothorax javanicus]